MSKKNFRFLKFAFGIVVAIFIFTVVSCDDDPKPKTKEIVYLPVQDNTMISSGMPDTNIYSSGTVAEDYLGVGNDCLNSFGGLGDVRSLLTFDSTVIPANADIISATLKLKFAQKDYLSDYAFNLDLHLMMGVWTQSIVTWNNAPPFEPVPAVIKSIPATTPSVIEMDVTQAVKDWFDGTKGNMGIILIAQIPESNNDLGLFLGSDRIVGLEPELKVDYYP